MIVVPQIAFHSREVAAGNEPAPLVDVLDLVSRGATEVALLDLDGALGEDGGVPGWLDRMASSVAVPIRLDIRLHDGRRIDVASKLRAATIVIDHRAMFDAMLLRWSLDLLGKRACIEVQSDGPYAFETEPGAFATELVDVVGALHLQGMRRMLLRDVTGDAVPLELLLELSDHLPNTGITFQGAVRSVDDIAALRRLGRSMEAVLVDGAAILLGDFDLAEAIRVAADPGAQRNL